MRDGGGRVNGVREGENEKKTREERGKAARGEKEIRIRWEKKLKREKKKTGIK